MARPDLKLVTPKIWEGSPNPGVDAALEAAKQQFEEDLKQAFSSDGAVPDVDTSGVLPSPYGLSPDEAQAKSEEAAQEMAAISPAPDTVDANAEALDKGRNKTTRRRKKKLKTAPPTTPPPTQSAQAAPASEPMEAVKRIQREKGLGEGVPRNILDRQKAPEIEGVTPQNEITPTLSPIELNLGDPKEEVPLSQSPENIAVPETPDTVVDRLQKEVDELRKQYAQSDVENAGKWGFLKGIFPHLKSSKDADTKFFESDYRSKLTDLKTAELERIKQSGLSGTALKQEMAGLLLKFKFNEPADLNRARIDARLAKQKWPGKVFGKLEQLGKAYNKFYGKLSLKTRMILSGMSVVIGVTAGAAPMIARRVVIGVGAAVGVDAALEKRAEKKEHSRAENETEEQLNLIIGDKEEKDISMESDLQDLERFLDEDIASLNKKLQKKKLNALLRKTVALGVGIGLGGAAGPLLEMIDNTDTVEAVKEKISALRAPSVEAAEMPAPEPYNPPTNAAQMAAVSEATAVGEGSVSAKILEDYKVIAEDGKKGLWGVLDKKLPDTLTGEDRNRAIAHLQQMMQEKLNGMSPAERAAAGFPTGNIDQIYKGTALHLDKVLSPDAVDKALSGEKIPSASVSVPDTPIRETVTEITPSASPLDQYLDAHTPTEAENTAKVREALITEYDDARDPKTYLKAHPEQVKWFNNKLGTLRMEIFLTSEVERLSEQGENAFADPKVGHTSAAQVLSDRKVLGSNPFASYDRAVNPLHYSQMQQFERFQAACEKAFGEGGAQVRAGATVNQHTAEMLTKAALEGVTIKGFFKP